MSNWVHQNYIECTYCILSPPHICPSLSLQCFKRQSHKSVQTLMRTYFCQLRLHDKTINNGWQGSSGYLSKTLEVETLECLLTKELNNQTIYINIFFRTILGGSWDWCLRVGWGGCVVGGWLRRSLGQFPGVDTDESALHGQRSGEAEPLYHRLSRILWRVFSSSNEYFLVGDVGLVRSLPQATNQIPAT